MNSDDVFDASAAVAEAEAVAVLPSDENKPAKRGRKGAASATSYEASAESFTLWRYTGQYEDL